VAGCADYSARNLRLWRGKLNMQEQMTN